MNKNDFYKQLMSEYTFDAEKIRNNAKKGRFARQKISPLTIGITASVAAATVACGTLAITMLDNKNGISLVDTGSRTLSDLSAAERVKAAIEQQNKDKDNEEIKDVLITFTSPLAPAQVEDILSEYIEGNVPVKAVYLSDSNLIMGNEQVAAVFKGEQTIQAVAVQCAASVKSDLQSDISVLLVEDWSESDFTSSVPISPEDVDDIETIEITIPKDENNNITPDITPDTDKPVLDVPGIDTPVTEAPDQSPENGDAPTEDETVETDTTSESEENNSTDETVEVPEPDETTDVPPEESNTDPVEPSVPEVPAQPEQPIQPVAPTLPDGVVLPENPDKAIYEIEHLNADKAFFLNNNIFLVKTKTDISLYNYNGYIEKLISVIDCSNAEIHWIAEKGNRMLVSGVDENGTRNQLWYIDASEKTIIDLKAKDVVMDGEIISVGYNASSEMLAINIKEEDAHYIAVFSLTSSGKLDFVGIPFDTTAKTSLLGANGSTLYVAATDGALTQVYAVDVYTNASRILKTYNNNPVISANYAFTYGIISPSVNAVTGKIEIFDPAAEMFTTTDFFSEKLVFGASTNSFYANGKVYTISGNAIVPASGLNTTAPIDYDKSFSATYMATVKNGKVCIYDSPYSYENKNGNLNFTHITSSGATEFRAALNGAIAIANALDLGDCEESGITTQTMLIDSMSVYYSKNAVKHLMSICSINEYRYSPEYVSGKLTTICVNDTELVINSSDENSAKGIVYVKTGPFAGKTAYRGISVSFVREDGVWKLDTIIR